MAGVEWKGPSVQSCVPLGPPAVQGAHLGNRVERGFHSAGSRGFHGDHGKVEPEVYSLDKSVCGVQVIILEESDPSFEARIPGIGVDPLKHLLSGLVRRMGLTGEDELNRFPRIGQKLQESVLVVEDQVGPLVGSKPPGEPNGQ